MRLTPYEKQKLGNINKRGRTGNYLFELLEEFANSDLDCVKVEEWTHKNATGCVTSLYRAIKRYNKTGIRVIQRRDEVYLIKDIKN